MMALRKALEHLKKHKVELEDPMARSVRKRPVQSTWGSGSATPMGYRWKLSVQNAKK